MTSLTARDTLYIEALEGLKYSTMDKLQRTLTESTPFDERVEAAKQLINKIQEIDDCIFAINH